jgi:hypothetical protein
VLSGTTEYFRSDLLSPLVAATLFPDMLQRLIPYPVQAFDRARGLDQAIMEARADFWTANESTNPFKESLNSLWSAGGAVPALFLNTTSVEMGARVTLSPLYFQPTPTAMHIGDPLCDGFDIPLASAVSLSARFPILTPAGWLQLDRKKCEWMRKDGEIQHGQKRDRLYLVDGGYFENSGLETALEVVGRLRALVRGCHVPKPSPVPGARRGGIISTPSYCDGLPAHGVDIRIIMVFAMDEFAKQFWSSDADLSSSGPGELLAPLKTMMNARRTRTRAVHIRQSLFDDDYGHLGGLRDGGSPADYARNRRFTIPDTPFLGTDDLHQVMLDGSKSFLPLGWRLSRRSMRTISESMSPATKMTYELIRHELMGEDTESFKRPVGPGTR